jgi:hypothetical protein
MKTSVRNQFAGKVVAVARGAVNDEVTIEILTADKKSSRSSRIPVRIT